MNFNEFQKEYSIKSQKQLKALRNVLRAFLLWIIGVMSTNELKKLQNGYLPKINLEKKTAHKYLTKSNKIPTTIFLLNYYFSY